MGEYIVSELDLNRLVVSYMESRMSLYSPISEPERIVRCKDCKHLYEFERKTWGSNIPYKVQQCEYWADSTWGSVEVEPDGFCAWGEVREDN